MNRILKFFLNPFRNELVISLWEFFILIYAVDCITWLQKQNYAYCFYVGAHDFLTAYLLTLLVGIVPLRFRSDARRFLKSILCCFLVVDLFCMINFHTAFNEDIAAIVRGTNINEAKEFFQTFLSVESMLLVMGGMGTLLLVLHLVKSRVQQLLSYSFPCQRSNRIFLAFHALAVVASILLMVRNPIWGETVLGKFYNLFSQESVPNLKDYYTHPVLEQTDSLQPENIVLIIGESLSKGHTSLYGYEKETNPFLTKLKEEQLLYTFSKVQSAEIGTIAAFKSIMAAWKPAYEDSVKWFECCTLPEIMQTAGYATHWISNQSARGLFDNIIGEYAALCDTSLFAGNKFSGLDRKTLDEETIALARPFVQDSISRQKSWYVIHLMGNHFDFKQRYPAHYAKFTPSDYTAYPEPQRQKRSEYDNSVLYNDSVVYELMNLFSEKEALVFYFPDHGLDIYKSSPSYIGHGKANDAISVKVAKQIPFMVYASPSYQQRFPQTMKCIKEHVDTPFETDQMIRMIMKVAGVKFKEK